MRLSSPLTRASARRAADAGAQKLRKLHLFILCSIWGYRSDLWSASPSPHAMTRPWGTPNNKTALAARSDADIATYRRVRKNFPRNAPASGGRRDGQDVVAVSPLLVPVETALDPRGLSVFLTA